ncbi:SPFH domain-containing protein [Tardiphaga sp. 866_E4_N2_1]|uniref:SPFH domain-containing protein n=1 Tax=unclassified Tardiphaga TaxID=2631404 RepID=UPI003F26F7AA
MIVYALVASLFILFVARRAQGKRGKVVPRRFVFGLPILAVLAVVIAYSFMIVQPGSTQVVVTFGKVQERRYDPGFHIVVPGSRHDIVWTRRQIFELSALDPDAVTATGAGQTPEAQRTLALSSDGIALSADITFPYQVNADIAWKVFTDIGPEYESALLIPAARAAVRQAVASFNWTDAVSSRRQDLEQLIHTDFKKLVNDNLKGAGFTTEQAENAFTLMAPQIRRLAPPKPILSAVSDRAASLVNLERQSVLNQIAEREAQRRANEGLGIKKLVDQLPKEMRPEQLQGLLYALADKQRADSMLKAVEHNQVKVMVMGGGSNAPVVSVPPPAQ